MDRNFLQIARNYEDGVISGSISACDWIELAAKRASEDRDRTDWEFYFDGAKAVAPCAFISNLKLVSDAISTKAGERFRLMDFQVFMLTQLFGWMRKDGGGRRFRKAYIEIPRGNTKSSTATAIALYMVANDGFGVQCVCAASLRPQARIVLDMARNIVLADPELRAAYGLEVLANEVRQTSTLNSLKALPAVATSAEGASINFGVLDEVHALRGRKLHDCLDTGCSKKVSSLFLCVTTAGDDTSGIAFEIHEYAERVLNGEAQDESFFTLIFTIDENDSWSDPKSWSKANPALGISVDSTAIANACKRAKQQPGMRNTFKSRHLNVWVLREEMEEKFLEESIVRKCYDSTLSAKDFAGRPATVGIDLASRLDLSSVFRIHTKFIEDSPEVGDPEDTHYQAAKGSTHYFAFGTSWLPTKTFKESANAAYAAWTETGELVLTEGSVTDQDLIESYVSDLLGQVWVRDISFDSLQSNMLMTHLEKKRLNLTIECPQSAKSMTPGVLLLQDAVAGGRFHTNSKVLLWCLSNLRVKRVGSSMLQPVRPIQRNQKIDSAVAVIMALISIAVKPLPDRTESYITLI